MLIDSLAKLNRSSRSAISAALIIIAAIAMYNRIVAPHAAYLEAAQQYGSVIADIAKKNEVVSNTLKSKKKRLHILREHVDELQSTLFAPDRARAFLGDLRAISEEAGCTVNSLNFTRNEARVTDGQAENTSGIAAEGATLSVTGVYSNIIRLAARLQARTKRVWINSVRIKSLDDNSAQVKCDISITIHTVQDKEAAQ